MRQFYLYYYINSTYKDYYSTVYQPTYTSDGLTNMATNILLHMSGKTADQLTVNGTALGKLIKLVVDGKVGRGNAKKILIAMFDADLDPECYAKDNGFIVSNDTGLIESVIKEAVAADPRAVADFKGGKEKALLAIFGKCMKQLKGNCDPQLLRQLLIEEINKT